MSDQLTVLATNATANFHAPVRTGLPNAWQKYGNGCRAWEDSQGTRKLCGRSGDRTPGERDQGRPQCRPVLESPCAYLQGQLKVDALGLDVMKGDILRLIFHAKRKEEISLPQAVMQFLDAFNQGNYPELEMTLDES